MITFLVVGRNDDYGVNLHKRTAISLNSFASLCQEPDDEILYVDCNTPDHDLTLAEAIADTLTPEARRRIRIYRITGEMMGRAIGPTPLPFSDELSRNVGIRRSNPSNPWLLSTNCDVVLHSLGNRAFADTLRALEPRFYACPRISIPIAQWQCLPRMDVGSVRAFCDAVVLRGFRFPPEKAERWLRFESVGDFQLAPREQWLRIRGCEEAMKLWGHSDANNALRLNLLNGGGETPDLGRHLLVMHLDHNPPRTDSHAQTHPKNDWKQWIEDVSAPESKNSDGWGLADLEIPAIRLNDYGQVPATEILRRHRRPRTWLRQARLSLTAGVLRGASRLLNRLKP